MYTVSQRADGANAGGMMPMTPDMQGIPPHWTNYFQVTDVVATTDKVKSLGGTVIVPPSPVPNVGSFAMYQDPQGAVFAVLQPSM
jgi:predicted enzyme related to lactoylglutathione lyase